MQQQLDGCLVQTGGITEGGGVLFFHRSTLGRAGLLMAGINQRECGPRAPPGAPPASQLQPQQTGHLPPHPNISAAPTGPTRPTGPTGPTGPDRRRGEKTQDRRVGSVGRPTETTRLLFFKLSIFCSSLINRGFSNQCHEMVSRCREKHDNLTSPG